MLRRCVSPVKGFTLTTSRSVQSPVIDLMEVNSRLLFLNQNHILSEKTSQSRTTHFHVRRGDSRLYTFVL